MQYQKIHSLWKREGRDMKGKFIEGEYSSEYFGLIKHWQVQEKIDGTNTRVYYNGDVVFKGRNDDSLIPEKFLNYLQDTFTVEKLREVFPDQKNTVRLFGEGYGPGIQTGIKYRSDLSFCLFDVFDGRWYEQHEVKDIANKLGLPYAPIIGIMTESEIVEYVKSQPLSTCSAQPQVIEGIIARPLPILLKGNREPLVFKLKVRDFKGVNRTSQGHE